MANELGVKLARGLAVVGLDTTHVRGRFGAEDVDEGTEGRLELRPSCDGPLLRCKVLCRVARLWTQESAIREEGYRGSISMGAAGWDQGAHNLDNGARGAGHGLLQVAHKQVVVLVDETEDGVCHRTYGRRRHR